MTELKPCPFCGGEAEVCEGGINGKMRVYGFTEHKDGCFFLANGLPTKYQHIMESEFDAWNTRAERTCKCTTDDSAWCFVCSECGKSFPRHKLYLAYNHGEINYCPNCGAKVVDE